MVQIINSKRERRDSFRSMALGVLIGWASMLIIVAITMNNQQDYLSSSITPSLMEQTASVTTAAIGKSSNLGAGAADDDSTSSSISATIPISAKLDLNDEALGDRSLPEASLDLHYTLRLKEFKVMEEPTYDKVMAAFHTTNIWKNADGEENRLDTMLDLWDLRKGNQKNGSPILDYEDRIDRFLLRTDKPPPRVIVEVGVFRGANSIHLAERLEKHGDRFKETFLICIDTWLLDLRYVWPQDQMTDDNTYFASTRVAGHEFMYFVFLANVMRAQMQHRIIPLQSSSLNGALALIAKGIRPDLIYLDASHANPDVFLDLINYWTILNPNSGVLVADDYKVALPVKAAIESFRIRFADEIDEIICPQNQCWIYKKPKAGAS